MGKTTPKHKNKLQKKWYKSKTLWFNGLTFLSLALPAIADPALIPSTKVLSVIGSLVTIVNILLRLNTSKGISS